MILEKVYIDTNIFLDALEDRKSKGGRDFGTPAMSIFSQAAHGRFKIIVSDWTLEELYKHADHEAVKELLSKMEGQIIRCEYTEEQKKEAQQSAKHWQDYLHGLIAKKEGADCIITQNVRDLRHLSGIKVKRPGHI